MVAKRAKTKVKKVISALKKASKTHAKQAKTLSGVIKKARGGMVKKAKDGGADTLSGADTLKLKPFKGKLKTGEKIRNIDGKSFVVPATGGIIRDKKRSSKRTR